MSYVIQIYRLDNGSFTALDEFDTYLSLDLFDRLNGLGSCNFSLEVNAVKAKDTVLRRTNVVAIKKNDTIIWVGEISKILKNYRGVGGTITVQCTSYLNKLSYAYTDSVVQYTDEDAGAIAQDLITTFQARTDGDLGITYNIQTTVDRDRTYYYKNIGEAIIQLSKVVNGFDFDFTYQQDSNHRLTGLIFNVYATRGTLRDDLPPLRLGENVQSASYATQNDLVNVVTALGVGTGENILTSIQTDTGSRGSFGRRELVLPAKDISIQTTLDQSAQGALIDLAAEKYNIDVELTPGSSPRLGDFVVGDILVVDFDTDPNSAITLNTNARVVELAISVDSNGAETLYPKLTTNI